MTEHTPAVKRATEKIRCLTLTIWWDKHTEKEREERVADIIAEETGADLLPECLEMIKDAMMREVTTPVVNGIYFQCIYCSYDSRQARTHHDHYCKAYSLLARLRKVVKE
ncbi:hypothetical protein C4561_01410 [candidate division WWE3 bacterium]|uniref:Uncharacterized protein n=1 Tax=candidate division WWE3 bacterium TaxID=2053526 RepID=A0A3A4ZM17_UNCKA|nr:MAG: hypothetical protein C4561_01410 [candidate division WWE3 bacterium]